MEDGAVSINKIRWEIPEGSNLLKWSNPLVEWNSILVLLDILNNQIKETVISFSTYFQGPSMTYTTLHTAFRLIFRSIN